MLGCPERRWHGSGWTWQLPVGKSDEVSTSFERRSIDPHIETHAGLRSVEVDQKRVLLVEVELKTHDVGGDGQDSGGGPDEGEGRLEGTNKQPGSAIGVGNAKSERSAERSR